MRLLPWLLAPVALALARLLPADGVGLALRLGAATACLLLPGVLVSRALGVGGFAGAFAWAMTAIFGATAVMFAVHGSLWLALILLAVLALVVVNALKDSPWGVFAILCTIPIAVLMGFWMKVWRPGHTLEASAAGVVLLIASLIGGRYVAESAALAPLGPVGFVSQQYLDRRTTVSLMSRIVSP